MINILPGNLTHHIHTLGVNMVFLIKNKTDEHFILHPMDIMFSDCSFKSFRRAKFIFHKVDVQSRNKDIWADS